MSKPDETTVISSDTDSAGAEVSSAEGVKNGQGDGAGGFIILFFIIGFVASLIIGWVVFPKLLYSQKTQPFDFNHALHLESVSDGCESCHIFRDDGTYAGVPSNAQCIGCHEEVQGDSPDEKIFVDEYISKEREVPWFVYSKQPDCVFFSHTAHVKKAGMECESCHGHIGESTSLKIYEENRITGYSRDIWGKNIAGVKRDPWDRMKMDDCAECHEKAGKKSSVQTDKEACFVCHK
jgi:menaquinone reductase, multiheme cytochrome c subunit